MDILDIDPETLEGIAKIIEGFSAKCSNIMDDYERKMSSLSSEWSDDRTMGEMLSKVTEIKVALDNMLDILVRQYAPYFRKKAEFIRQRPTFN